MLVARRLAGLSALEAHYAVEGLVDQLTLARASTAMTVTPSQSLEPVQPEDDAPRNGRR